MEENLELKKFTLREKIKVDKALLKVKEKAGYSKSFVKQGADERADKLNAIIEDLELKLGERKGDTHVLKHEIYILEQTLGLYREKESKAECFEELYNETKADRLESTIIELEEKLGNEQAKYASLKEISGDMEDKIEGFRQGNYEVLKEDLKKAHSALEKERVDHAETKENLSSEAECHQANWGALKKQVAENEKLKAQLKTAVSSLGLLSALSENMAGSCVDTLKEIGCEQAT